MTATTAGSIRSGGRAASLRAAQWPPLQSHELQATLAALLAWATAER